MYTSALLNDIRRLVIVRQQGNFVGDMQRDLDLFSNLELLQFDSKITHISRPLCHGMDLFELLRPPVFTNRIAPLDCLQSITETVYG